MSAQNFRSAFNGFNREDVVHYIEYLNAKHTAEINQLHSDIDLLQAKADAAAQDTALQEQLAAAEAARDDYKNRLDEALTKIAELESTAADASVSERCSTLEAQLQEALAAKTQAEAARDAAIQKAAACQVEQELEAYRRAERTERIARQRAEQVYHQANGALADATAKVDEASAQITEVTDKVSAQLTLLQQAVTSSKQALADAAATLFTIRPGSTEE